jgi:hypothetical protein
LAVSVDLGLNDALNFSMSAKPPTDWMLQMTLSNREQWLANLAIAVRPHIASTIAGGGDEESAIRLSCGFPPKTGRKAVGASIVPPTASADFTAEIFVSPTVDDASAVARLVLPLLKVAQAGKPLETLPSWCEPILANLGSYPHAKIELTEAPKQSTRLIKVACLNDNYIARVSRSTLVNLGAPICPACNQSLVEA